MATKTHTFPVKPGTSLSLTDLTHVTVRAGEPGSITVTVTGSDTYLRDVTAENTGRAVMVSEPRNGGDVVISGGNVTIGGSTSGVIVTGSGVRMTNRFGSGGSTSIITGGGRVVVNGVDVTSAVQAGQPDIDQTPRTIVVTVPVGTNVRARGCQHATIAGTGAKVGADLSGVSTLDVRFAAGLRIDLAGQSRAVIADSTGDATLDVSGQSTVSIHGTYGELDVDVSGQSSVRASGEYDTVTGEAAGMSVVDVTGQVGSDSIRTSGMSRATVNGRPSGRRAGRPGGWDF